MTDAPNQGADPLTVARELCSLQLQGLLVARFNTSAVGWACKMIYPDQTAGGVAVDEVPQKVAVVHAPNSALSRVDKDE